MCRLWALALCLGVAHAGDPIAEHDKAYGRPELARIGTVGDRPPPESTVVIHVHADGAILIDGKETTLDGLFGAFLALRERHAEPSALLRADARLPWGAVQWLLTICAEQKVDRVFYAVLPGTGDEGAFSWPLPRARESDPTSTGPGKPPVTVGLLLGAPAAEPAHLYWAAREAKPECVELKAGKLVPLGFVLSAADALHRAGVRRVTGFDVDIPPAAARRSDLRPRLRQLREQPAYGEDRPKEIDPTRIRVRFGERALGEAKASPMPAVDRVRGGLAGWQGPVYIDEPEELEEPEEPEPEIPEEQVVEPMESEAQEPCADDPRAPDAVEEGLSDSEPVEKPGGKKRRVRTPAVEPAALAWLAAHQDLADDGKWDCDGFMKHDPADDRCDGAGGALNDVGVTGLAVLAFLGAGYTDRGSVEENRYARNVRAALRYLMTTQADDGAFGSRETRSSMYQHAIATTAMCEAYFMTRNPRYGRPAQAGLDYIAAARNPDAGWRYAPRGGDSDTSVTAWCAMALRSGEVARLDVAPDALRGAREWVERMTAPDTGRVGYRERGGLPDRPKGMGARWPPARSESMTAAGIFTRIRLGEDPRGSAAIKAGAKLCTEAPPHWNPDTGTIDMYYWYWGTLAMFQVGGRPWDTWMRAMREAIVNHQHPKGSGSRTGSWDPLDPWGAEGGRVYSTALMMMCLEVYYRY